MASRAFDELEGRMRTTKPRFLGMRLNVIRNSSGDLELDCSDRAPKTPKPRSLDWISELSIQKQFEDEYAALSRVERHVKTRIEQKAASIGSIFDLPSEE